MRKITILVMVLVFCNSIALFGKSLTFRSGEILNAEYSKNAVTIKNVEKLFLSQDKVKNYAVVYVKLSPKRTISIFDYKLLVGKNSYPIIAIQKNYDGFEYTTENLIAKNSNDIFSLIFFVDEDLANKSYYLQATFPPIENNKVNVPFKAASNGIFSESTMIKLDGNF